VVTSLHPLSRDLDEVLVHALGLWKALDGRRILITGGTGYVGSWLLETLAWARECLCCGPTAVVVSRRPDDFLARRSLVAACTAITLVEGDVADFPAPAGRFDLLVHGAAEAGTRQAVGGPGELQRTIIDGTRHVLDIAQGVHARRLLLLSSGAVYGLQPAGVGFVEEGWDVEEQLDPRHAAYGSAKRLAEELCLAAASDALDVVIARGFSFVGPYQPLDAHFAVGNFIRDVLAGGPVVVRGDGSAVRSYLYATDMAVWLWSILARGRPGCAYNVGSERAVSVAQLAHLVAACRDGIRVVVQGEPDQGTGRYVPCTRRAREELGVRETVGLEQGVARTIAWHAAGGGG
jgi:nucleoside-diphosphate-sugar epimerase